MSINNFNPPKVALVYDRVNKFGGAERLLLALHQLFPHAPLFTLVYHPTQAPWAKAFTVHPSFLNHLSPLRSRHEILALLSPLAFETFNFNNFDIVISVTSEAAKSVITQPHTLHLCYCLTPTRYLFSHAANYHTQPGLGVFSKPAQLFLKSASPWLTSRDLIHSHRPDHYLAISAEIKRRLRRYYHQDSDVVYPPIDYSFWSKVTRLSPPKSPYFLLVSRLVPYKQVDLVIKAFRLLKGSTLHIVGTGSQLTRLRRLAPANVKFLGQVSDIKLRQLYAQAQALIFPQLEDFGLTALEAQAVGTPVIAFEAGGACETVISHHTGILYSPSSTHAIIKAVTEFDQIRPKLTSANCRRHAQRFDLSRFHHQFSATVNSLWQKHLATLS